MKKKIKLTLSVVIILLFLLAILSFDAQSLLDSVRYIPIWLMGFLLVLQIITQLLINLQWQMAARFAGIAVSFRDIFYINSQGAIIDSITPGVKFGGEVTRVVQISRIGKASGKEAAGVVALQKLFSLGAFFFINLFAVGFLVGRTELLSAVYLQILVFGLLFFFLFFFAAIFIMPQQIRVYLGKKKEPRYLLSRKIKNFMISLLGQVISIRKNKKVWIFLLFLSLFIWLLYPLKMYLLAIQVLPGSNLLFVSASTFAAYMVAMIPIFPGGLGGFEGTLTGLFLVMGITASDALAVAIIFRFVTFWFVMLLGLVFIGFYKLKNQYKDIP